MPSQRTTFTAGRTRRPWAFASTWPTWIHVVTWIFQATWSFVTSRHRTTRSIRLKQRLSHREAVKFNAVCYVLQISKELHGLHRTEAH